MNRMLEIVHPECPASPRAIAERRAVRGIVLRVSRILLLYVAEDEGLEEALVREMIEETGARSVHVVAALGRIDESRPHWGDNDAMHMQSFVFRCLVEG